MDKAGVEGSDEDNDPGSYDVDEHEDEYEDGYEEDLKADTEAEGEGDKDDEPGLDEDKDEE